MPLTRLTYAFACLSRQRPTDPGDPISVGLGLTDGAGDHVSQAWPLPISHSSSQASTPEKFKSVDTHIDGWFGQPLFPHRHARQCKYVGPILSITDSAFRQEPLEERYDCPMTIEVTEEPITALPEYARVPIIFTVDCVLDVTNRDDGPHGFAWSERRLEVPYEKDYDAIAGEGPLQWPRRFNLSNWAFFLARCATRVVGGAAVAFDTSGLTMLEGRRDLAVLWDIRVSPDARRRGVGSALLERVETWAQLHGCRQLKIETQNTNVRACRFYERRGCQLRAIHRGAYPDLPDEIQLFWYKDLPR